MHPQLKFQSDLQRAKFILAGKGKSPSEIVVKLISSPATRNEVSNLVKYVMRLREGDQNEPRQILHNAYGEEIIHSVGFEEGRHKTAAFLKNIEDDLYEENGRPLMRHFSVSYPKRDEGFDHVLHNMAVEASIKDVFLAEGYEAWWVTHNCPEADKKEQAAGLDGDHDHIHTHILVNTKSMHDPEGLQNALKYNREDLQVIRSVFADYGRDLGLEVEASPQLDRTELREEILDLDRQLENFQTYVEDVRSYNHGIFHPSAKLLEKRAPHFHEEMTTSELPGFTEEIERELKDHLVTELGDSLKAVDQDSNFQQFEEPIIAWLRWRACEKELKRREGKGDLANWFLENRPEVFGDLTEGAPDRIKSDHADLRARFTPTDIILTDEEEEFLQQPVFRKLVFSPLVREYQKGRKESEKLTNFQIFEDFLDQYHRSAENIIQSMAGISDRLETVSAQNEKVSDIFLKLEAQQAKMVKVVFENGKKMAEIYKDYLPDGFLHRLSDKHIDKTGPAKSDQSR